MCVLLKLFKSLVIAFAVYALNKELTKLLYQQSYLANKVWGLHCLCSISMSFFSFFFPVLLFICIYYFVLLYIWYATMLWWSIKVVYKKTTRHVGILCPNLVHLGYRKKRWCDELGKLPLIESRGPTDRVITPTRAVLCHAASLDDVAVTTSVTAVCAQSWPQYLTLTCDLDFHFQAR